MLQKTQLPTPLIASNPFTAQTANPVPNVTGKTPAPTAHQVSRENGKRLRASLKMRPAEKQIEGVTITSNIQNKGVADQLALNPLVA